MRISAQAHSVLPPGSVYSCCLQVLYLYLHLYLYLYRQVFYHQDLSTLFIFKQDIVCTTWKMNYKSLVKLKKSRSKLLLFPVDCTICFALVLYCVECSLSKSVVLSIGRSERALVMDRLGSVATGVTYAFSSSSTTMMVVLVVMMVMIMLVSVLVMMMVVMEVGDPLSLMFSSTSCWPTLLSNKACY